MKQIDCVISGRVQLVMYRDFTRRTARSMGILGTVRNREDGTVKVVAQGSETDLMLFIELLRKGPVLARVRHIEVVWSEPMEVFHNFNIIYLSFFDRI